MIKRILEKYRSSGYMHIDDFIEENDDIMAIIAMGFFLLINTMGMIIRWIYPETLNLGKEIIQVIILLLLAIGMKRVIDKKSKRYSLLILAFLLSLLNQFIFPAENFYVGYFTLIASLVLILLLLTFLYKLRRYSFYFFAVCIGFLYTYDFLFLKPNNELVIEDIRFIMTFLLIIIYGVTRLIKSRYYQIMNYIYRLMYHDIETSLLNRLQLIHDLEISEEKQEDFYLLAIDFLNIEALNRRYDYLTIINTFKGLLLTIKDKYDLELYRIDSTLIGFIFKDLKDIDKLLSKLETILRKRYLVKDGSISFDYQLIGTSVVDKHKEPKDLINYIYQVRYSSEYRGYEISPHKIFWYDEETFKRNRRQITIESDIKEALRKGDFEIYIQPKIALKDSNFYSGEVLSRWHHPELGYISPYEFIPIIEEKKLMVDFTRHIIKESQEFIKRFEKNIDIRLRLAINISSSVFRSNNILALVMNNISAGYFKYFELEITEDVVFEMNEEYLNTIKKLKDMGIKLALDDFGTGFSNFEYLQELQINTLKIDKKFIDSLVKEKRSKLLVKAMIDMAHALEMNVVAEGVEDLEQLEILKNLDCDEIQGYYYSKALDKNNFIKYCKDYK
ncbi:MAG TPA: EAL domain-containing protein [Clostridia bacterium]|nr:EAL domain-containing protein [Clostridia bacterium]